MRLRLSSTGSLIAAVAAVAGFLLLAAGIRVYGAITPPRRADPPPDLAGLDLPVEPIRFESVDGLRLEGWHFPGEPGVAPLVLCHDFGQSKGTLLGLALDLAAAGFPVLVFDFRGHGASEGTRSTLGLEEKRDVLGAIDHLAGLERYHGSQFGIYGVGMGAHASVLAARDRRSIRVLVLDALYPDASFRLVRRVYAGWGVGVRRMGFLPEAIFALLNGQPLDGERAAEVIPSLTGRDVLLLAPAGDAVLAAEIRRMYESIPEQRNVDPNLVLLPATQSQGLYGENLTKHHRQVEEFFLTRLGAQTVAVGP